MHAQYVRVWFLAGLLTLALSIPLAFLSPLAPTLLVVGVSYLALAVALGLLPAFARRDWPSPVFAYAGALLGAAGIASAPYPRAAYALLGASLVVGAAQPLALLLSPAWTSAREPNAHTSADGAALAAIGLALAGALAGGLLLVALPRGLPNAALVALLLACALPAALAALLFALPRAEGAPLKGATLAYAALGFLALGAGALAWAFARPIGASFRTPVAILALAYALAVTALLRVERPAPARPLLASALALAILAALALLLATLYDAPNALLPVALYAHAALALALLGAALVVASPLLLPGRAREGRWRAWSMALLIGALFLYTPAIQYGRGHAPALLLGAAGLALLLWGLLPLSSSARPAMRRR